MGKYKLKIGFFPGTFDLVHAGHILAFKEAKKYCDILAVFIKDDPTIDALYKSKPILSLQERKIILKAIRYIDIVGFYKTEKQLQAIDKVGPYDIRFMGLDHKGEKTYPTKAKKIYISRNHKYSSSMLRKRIIEAEKIKNGMLSSYRS